MKTYTKDDKIKMIANHRLWLEGRKKAEGQGLFFGDGFGFGDGCGTSFCFGNDSGNGCGEGRRL